MEGAASVSLLALQTGPSRMRRTPPAMPRGSGSLRRRADRRAALGGAEVRDLTARTLAQPRPLVHDDPASPTRDQATIARGFGYLLSDAASR